MEQQFAQFSKLVLSYLPEFDKVFALKLDMLLALEFGRLFVLALLLCLTGLPVLAAVGQGLAYSRGRSAYDKCARQLGRLAVQLGLIVVIVGGVALGMQYQSLLALDIKNPAAWENFLPLLMVGGWLCVVLSTLLNCLYTGLWQSRRTVPRLHQLLALLAALASAAAVYAALLYLHAGTAAPVASAPADLRVLLMPGTEGFWVAVSYAPFAALALAGGYGALWLLLRRVADDYGRDHYNLVIPWCAGWASNFWLLLWLFVTGRMGWRVFHLYEAAGGKLDWFQFMPDCVWLIVLLLPGLWWMRISRSMTPLRAKIAMPIAPLWATGCLLLLDMGLG